MQAFKLSACDNGHVPKVLPCQTPSCALLCFYFFVPHRGTKIMLCIVYPTPLNKRFAGVGQQISAAMPYALLCHALLQNALGCLSHIVGQRLWFTLFVPHGGTRILCNVMPYALSCPASKCLSCEVGQRFRYALFFPTRWNEDLPCPMPCSALPCFKMLWVNCPTLWDKDFMRCHALCPALPCLQNVPSCWSHRVGQRFFVSH